MLIYQISYIHILTVLLHYPTMWKHTKVILLPKSQNEFRPIGILLYLSKGFQFMINNQIRTSLNNNSVLTDKQMGSDTNIVVSLFFKFQYCYCSITRRPLTLLIMEFFASNYQHLFISHLTLPTLCDYIFHVVPNFS